MWRLFSWHFFHPRDHRKFSQFEGVRAAQQGLPCAVGGNSVSCSLVPAWAKNLCMELPVEDVFATTKVRAVPGLLWQIGDLVRRAIHKCSNKKFFFNIKGTGPN